VLVHWRIPALWVVDRDQMPGGGCDESGRGGVAWLSQPQLGIGGSGRVSGDDDDGAGDVSWASKLLLIKSERA
jgi:hypothetical protein